MSPLKLRLQRKDQEIERLKGALDCSNGLPAKSNSIYYGQGYSNQYAAEQQRTHEMIKEF